MKPDIQSMSDKTIARSISVLSVGLDQACLDIMTPLFENCRVKSLPYDFSLLMEQITPDPDIIVCGPAPIEISLIEVAQMLRMQYTQTPIYYITHNRTNYDRKNFIKNGFTESYLLPLDNDELVKGFNEAKRKASKLAPKTYRAVKIVDIRPGDTLDFETNVFLPLNNRYVQYTAAGVPLTKEKAEKLTKHGVKNVFVSTDQMQKFYKYTARVLRDLGNSNAISETEKRERVEGAVRDLISNVLQDTGKDTSFDQGQNLLNDCRQVVNTFILDSSESEWYSKLMKTVGELASSYNHATNVSTYAALFAIGVGIGDPAQIAVAGMLHDIGLVDVPAEILAKREEDMTNEEKEIFYRHPENTINILKQKKVSLSEDVYKMILQHHEKFNGSGYPKGMLGSKIMKEAQILALADRFDELTNAGSGKTSLTPREAIMYFKKQVSRDPSKMDFDPALLNGILKLFPTEDTHSETSSSATPAS